ncbi:uncharacterized protein DUF2357 [Anaeroplasma bactoclasticum]|jgi:hypothetical protein|uniref:Uncharacterized protein DUF2357 n=1 Tax=Anaeroplasma bactoclasticum TaxID=2088 RepID=A0A397RMT7_9MOLU|nr:DUF2357 domain-containing protein [Anaeroplasma bactoclasticum]RIA75433.1 uncharacterized protein DUF2357 [Anaeroplasma bactoclasticum]
MAKKDKNFESAELEAYYTKAYQAIDNETQNDTYGSYVLNRVKGGQKTVFNKTQSEIRNFDMSFLDTIESVYPAITKIMRDPKKSLRYETEVVNVEKARKTNSDTVKHLSSHTHLIKEITKEGDVVPSKVLNTYAEEELAIYENRFIKSLVKRLEMFLERRYEVMKISLESFETERLSVQNEFLMSGQTVTVGIDVAIKNDLTTNVETTKEQYNRLLYIREMVQALKGTDFMRALAKARDVHPPIMKTNIIMHNPDFKLCYGLWLYLDRVDGIATNIDVKEKSYKYSASFDKDINDIMTLALTSFIKNRQIDGIYSSRKVGTVKAPKPIENQSMELEMNLEADNNKLEDYTMNQVLLDQTVKYFEGSMQGLQQTGSTYNESVRVVYRQMLDMVDQLYPKAFGVSDDEFDSADLYKQLEYARREMMVAKIVKQTKQMALAKMGREEKRIEKLIAKIEEKIKKKEAKDRERLAREEARIEAQRQAALERERRKEAKRKALEKAAVEKAQEVERKLNDRKKAMEKANASKIADMAKMHPLLEKKRNHLKDLREKERGKWDNPDDVIPEIPAEAAMPVRRRDDYDDLSDAELEALMAENEMLDVPGNLSMDEEVEKPKKKVVKKVVKKAPEPEAKPEEKKKAKKAIEEISDENLDELSDEELDALLGLNSGFTDFNAADVAGDDDLDSDKPVLTKKAKGAPSKKKEEPKEEPKDDFDSFLDSIPEKEESDEPEPELSTDALEEALEDNKDTLDIKDEDSSIDDIVNELPNEYEAFPEEDMETKDSKESDDFDSFLDSIPEKDEKEPEVSMDAPVEAEVVVEEPEAVEEPVEEAPKEAPKAEPKKEAKASDRDEFADIVHDKKNDGPVEDDDFDNMSDEELEALMAQNDML